jgi:flagellar biosynthetic protein FliO
MFNPIILLKMLKKWLETSTPRQKLAAGLLVFSLLATGTLLAMNNASQTASDPLGSTPLYFASVFIKLIGVLFLIVGSTVLLRRWMLVSPTGKAARQLHLLETVRLSPKQALHLIVVGDQQLLIGATDQSIALIAPIEGSLNLTPVEASQPKPSLDFGSILQSFSFNRLDESLKGKG